MQISLNVILCLALTAGMATAERTEVKLRNEQRVGLNYDISVQYGGLHVFASVGRPLATCG